MEQEQEQEQEQERRRPEQPERRLEGWRPEQERQEQEQREQEQREQEQEQQEQRERLAALLRSPYSPALNTVSSSTRSPPFRPIFAGIYEYILVFWSKLSI